MQKSMSKSGIDTRSGLRNRSNSRSYGSGSRSVMPSAHATSEPAPEPRPGPTRDVVVLGPVDEVRHDQEVAGEPHLDDDVQLDFQARVVILARLARRQRVLLEAFGQALARAACAASSRWCARWAPGRPAARTRRASSRRCSAWPARRRCRWRRARRRTAPACPARTSGTAARCTPSADLGIVEHAAGGDAHARLVRVEAFGVQEAHVVAGHDAAASAPPRRAGRRR